MCAVALAAAVGAGACASSPQPVDSQKSENRLKLCDDFLHGGELEAAEKECQKALAYQPQNELAHNSLGLIDMVQAGRVTVVLEIDDCLTGVDADGLRQELDTHLMNADEHFRAALESASDYGEAYHNRATVMLLLEEHQAAVELFTEALARSQRLQNPALTRAGLGWAYFQLGNHPKAAAELRKAVSFAPHMCLAQYRLARVYFAREEWENAARHFQQVLDEKCPIQEAYLYQMKTYLQLGYDVTGLREGCLSLAPRSCVAAQCRAVAP